MSFYVLETFMLSVKRNVNKEVEMEHMVFWLPSDRQHAQEQLNELAAQGWRVVAAAGERIIMCRAKPSEDE